MGSRKLTSQPWKFWIPTSSGESEEATSLFCRNLKGPGSRGTRYPAGANSSTAVFGRMLPSALLPRPSGAAFTSFWSRGFASWPLLLHYRSASRTDQLQAKQILWVKQTGIIHTGHRQVIYWLLWASPSSKEKDGWENFRTRDTHTWCVWLLLAWCVRCRR